MSLLSRICFSPRNVFKFHSRLISIFLCSFIAILFCILVGTIAIRPVILYMTSNLEVFGEVFGILVPLIGSSIKQIVNNADSVVNLNADKINEIVDIFQEMIFKGLNSIRNQHIWFFMMIIEKLSKSMNRCM